jgi:hypothetical protein
MCSGFVLVQACGDLVIRVVLRQQRAGDVKKAGKVHEPMKRAQGTHLEEPPKPTLYGAAGSV